MSPATPPTNAVWTKFGDKMPPKDAPIFMRSACGKCTAYYPDGRCIYDENDEWTLPSLKTGSTLDAELVALAALANVEAVLMAGDNQVRAGRGESPAWAYGHGIMPAGTALQEELYRRGYRV